MKGNNRCCLLLFQFSDHTVQPPAVCRTITSQGSVVHAETTAVRSLAITLSSTPPAAPSTSSLRVLCNILLQCHRFHYSIFYLITQGTVQYTTAMSPIPLFYFLSHHSGYCVIYYCSVTDSIFLFSSSSLRMQHAPLLHPHQFNYCRLEFFCDIFVLHMLKALKIILVVVCLPAQNFSKNSKNS